MSAQDCNANGVADAVDVRVVHWTAAYGLAPDDQRIGPQHRFAGAPFQYQVREFLRVLDASESQELGISKNDASTLVQIGSNWALEVTLRMISHSRPSLDWGATIGIELYGKSVRLAVSRDGAGFQASDGNAWLAGQFASINTDDAFHSFRIARSGPNVRLFIDSAQQPAITIPLADFSPSSYGDTANVIAASTSNGGVAEYLVESITFNPASVETRNVADCNANAVPDLCDVNSGTSLDETNDGVPDECQCVGDLTGDRAVRLSDLALLLSNFGSCCGDAEFYVPADIDNRCCVDLADLALLLKRFGLQCN